MNDAAEALLTIYDHISQVAAAQGQPEVVEQVVRGQLGPQSGPGEGAVWMFALLC